MANNKIINITYIKLLHKILQLFLILIYKTLIYCEYFTRYPVHILLSSNTIGCRGRGRLTL